MSRIIIEVNDSLHKQIKALAAIHGQSIKQFVLDKISIDENSPNSIKNKITATALKNAIKEQNLIKYKTKKDLYKDLGI